MRESKVSSKDGKQQSTILGMELGIDVDKRVLKSVVVLVLELGVMVAIGLMFLVPKWNEVVGMRNNLSKQQEQLRGLRNKLAILEQFEVERTGYETVLGMAFPLNKDVGTALRSLRTLANDARIEIVGYRVDPVMIEEDENDKPSSQGLTAAPTPALALPSSGMPAKSEAKAEGFMMEVTISGSALAIQDFLDRVGRSLPLKVVENVVIARGEEVKQESGEMLEMRLEIKNYYLPMTSKANPTGILRALKDEEIETIETIRGYRGVDTGVSGDGESVPLGNQNLFGE